MKTKKKIKAEYVVDSIFIELSSRKGFEVIEHLRYEDEEVFYELMDACVAILLKSSKET